MHCLLPIVAKAAAVYKTRRTKQVGWWGSIEEWATGMKFVRPVG